MGEAKERNPQRDYRTYHKRYVFLKIDLWVNHCHYVHWRTDVDFMKEGVKQWVNSRVQARRAVDESWHLSRTILWRIRRQNLSVLQNIINIINTLPHSCSPSPSFLVSQPLQGSMSLNNMNKKFMQECQGTMKMIFTAACCIAWYGSRQKQQQKWHQSKWEAIRAEKAVNRLKRTFEVMH